MVVKILRYKQTDKLTGSTPGFDGTLLGASHDVFLTTILFSLCNPRAPALTATEHTEVSSSVEKVTTR